ncbi:MULTISPECIES: 50S ribosomal protein P1 [Haloferax]|uniref:Large ribosomal subunit protein P1 n=6 Tax=Haloferax TaxID=2251 RepID=RL12_HALVD|nr:MULTISPECIES: 50S ribosomal protein P1 [Haloferax]P41197.1 RecName: Full=Large ribosomal subunit protein P1; AltName: Full=50S ribosomal protein L12 [Haloferax volcanii DS2]ADE05052.1 50S ribosomal protein L12 [Haloferax volcanii DS2]ELK54726.1 50S ribosomal protein L12P [Haloferax sp. BAB-2207]ELY32347.1 50S ribosomal protein L12P [Haloferax volcanii DS2]ELZ54728.1 50S ribosomal protein L12P [Haloferax sp. ATCC BAA-646]ELZ65840.1 50S ribosomal protein L12P [Haloferax sp. ATCC BAA-644]
MEYVYAALILNESDEEVNEENITAVLEAAGVDVEESRVKALVAALEDVDIEEAIETAAAAPAPAAGGSAGGEVEAADDDDEEDAEEEAADEGGDDDGDDDEEADGEGLGALFG